MFYVPGSLPHLQRLNKAENDDLFFREDILILFLITIANDEQSSYLKQENEDYSTLSGILIGVGFLLILISFGARRRKGSAKKEESLLCHYHIVARFSTCGGT